MNASNDGTGDETPAVMTLHDFPDPTDDDFEEDISTEEREYYMEKFSDVNTVIKHKLHCTACDRHLGCSSRIEPRLKIHPMLKTLVCQPCHTFYNSGEFEKGDDGSELYCRWCGQGGQVYCCSKCPHVFCAKCVKRNFGVSKIKEIEDTDDWQCFRCKPKCMWDLRALCWAVIRFCTQRSRIAHQTTDPDTKQQYIKENVIDFSECCKTKKKKSFSTKQKLELPKRECKEKENDSKKTDMSAIVSKISPHIQVKKFAMISAEPKQEKKAQKRPASPLPTTPPQPKTIMLKNPVALPPLPKIRPAPFVSTGPNPFSPFKKIRLQAPPPQNNFNMNRMQMSYTPRIRPKPSMQQPKFTGFGGNFNGPNNYGSVNLSSDNINLSLENLTQGLDMAVVSAMANMNNLAHMDNPPNDLVCTPDFPLEPVCEVTEDNGDDDVECITPGPIAAPKNNMPSLIPRSVPLSERDIIQMTENDVTVNRATGGLKFRVNPQTLSSNKMYRLPDGRVFAININPNMPGGYSATIVSTNDSNVNTSKGPTFAAKVSSVSNKKATTTTTSTKNKVSNKNVTPPTKEKRRSFKKIPVCDLDVPVEWYRFNLIETIDALEYSLSRLKKLKTNANTVNLRSSSVLQVKKLSKTLDTLLKNSVTRFEEIRENLNKEVKKFTEKKKKQNETHEISDVENEQQDDEDDDVEILSVNNDPIFIEEDSVDSLLGTQTQDNPIGSIDLDSSDLTESGEKLDSRLQLGTDKQNKLDQRNDTEPMEESAGESRELSDTQDANENLNNEDKAEHSSNIEKSFAEKSNNNDDESLHQKDVQDTVETDKSNENEETEKSEKENDEEQLQPKTNNKHNDDNDKCDDKSHKDDVENNKDYDKDNQNTEPINADHDKTKFKDKVENKSNSNDNKDNNDGHKPVSADNNLTEDIIGVLQNLIKESNEAEANACKDKDRNKQIDTTFNGDNDDVNDMDCSIENNIEKEADNPQRNDDVELITDD